MQVATTGSGTVALIATLLLSSIITNSALPLTMAMEGHKPASFLPIHNTQHKLAYHYQDGNSPAVLFCSGFRSSMNGNKALAIEVFCRRKGLASCRFDYRGHGESSGDFDDLTLSDWIQDASNILTGKLGQFEQVILVGSSMGAWISCHLAMKHSSKVVGILGLASAPDFLQDIFESLGESEQSLWQQEQYLDWQTEYNSLPYRLSWQLLEDARDNWGLFSKYSKGERLPIHCRVRLLHGDKDASISCSRSWMLAEAIESDDAAVRIIPGADHRLSSDLHLECIKDSLKEILDSIKVEDDED